MYKEYAILRKKPDGEIEYAGFPTWYNDFNEAKSRYDYCRTEWRKELKAEVEKEDLNKTNWAHMAWSRKKNDKFILVERAVTPYKILEEEE